MCWDLNWAGGRRVLLVVLAASLRLLNPIVALPPPPPADAFALGPSTLPALLAANWFSALSNAPPLATALERR